ncbi:MAG: hypothetical protein QOK47_494 [Actinomycetota bacterium]|jgi:RimJ/RimL family protein N-acetyltransferase|nr:hypothetical protein [Actinomycetota bacterium]
MSLEVQLREVRDDDLPIFFEHQLEPDANQMAAFPARNRDGFMAHWAKIRADETTITRSIVVGDEVAGNVVSWIQDGKRLIGYWVGKDHWGKGIATEALRQLLSILSDRPLFANVAKHNVGSIRVLEKCGFIIIKAAQPVDAADGIEEFLLELSA